ncbi:AAA family ATPase [Pseudoxanthomonas mexicana]
MKPVRAGVTVLDLASSITVDLIPASGIETRSIDWIWEGWLARGKTHLLAGDAGTGKTTLAMKMAATVSAGGEWPDGSVAPTGNVLVWSGEDDPEDTLVPRLHAAGADLDRIFVVGETRRGHTARAFDPSTDMELLIARAAEIGDVSLVVIDPVIALITGDGHKSTDVRRGLQPLVELASLLRCAVVGISHFSKSGGAGTDPLLRVTGSVAFGAVVRVVMVAAKKRGEDHRVLARAKSNIGPDDGGWSYKIDVVESPLPASVAVWGEALTGDAADLIEGRCPGERVLDQAQDWLEQILTAGPVVTTDVKAAAEAAGYSWRSLERAKATLGVRSRKDGPDGAWRWSLPGDGV